MPDDAFLDLKIANTEQVIAAVSVELVRRWAAEGRVTASDMVRPVGAQNWIKISLAPEFSGQPVGRKQVRPLPKVAVPVPGAAKGTRNELDEPTADLGITDLGITVPARSRPRRRRWSLEDASIDMTPMIDVTFQLLIFFMLTNKAANPSLMDVPKVRNGQGIDPFGRQVVLVDADNSYYLGDRAVPENRIESLDQLAERVATNASSSDVETSMEVLIHAHRNSRHASVRQLMERLNAVEGVGPIRLGVEEKD